MEASRCRTPEEVAGVLWRLVEASRCWSPVEATAEAGLYPRAEADGAPAAFGPVTGHLCVDPAAKPAHGGAPRLRRGQNTHAEEKGADSSGG